MAQWLKALSGSIPSTHIVAHNPSVSGNLCCLLASASTARTWYKDRLTGTNIHIHKVKINKFKLKKILVSFSLAHYLEVTFLNH